jgi:hypothetical protein
MICSMTSVFVGTRNIVIYVCVYIILSNNLSRLTLYIDEIIGVISVSFDVTDQLLIRFSTFIDTGEKNGSTMRQYISYS